MSWFSRLFGQQREKAVPLWKQRLQMVLIHDREVSPGLLEQIKDIIKVDTLNG
ncbi:MAG: cell division topological specificity factor MinE [Ardenticatenaceae bacterium]|nr:cell division topological specificity factor MinE [Ardenticatenaceae bacterium]